MYSGLDIKTGRLIAVKQVQIGKSDDEEKEMANLEKEVSCDAVAFAVHLMFCP